MANVNPIPQGYHSVTPYLFIKGAAEAIEYYKKVFAATERMRMPGPNGRIMHAEIEIGDSTVMISDENPQVNSRSPQTIGGTSCCLHVYVKDVDTTVQAAANGGAKITQPVENRFYGDRTGTLIDPFGHMWSVATHIEDVTPEEMKKRMAKMTQTASA
jgi:PhnB protein